MSQQIYIETNGRYGIENGIEIFFELLRGIKKLSEDSTIMNICKAVTFDAYYRNPYSAIMSKGYESVNPDKATIENIRVLSERSIKFFTENGPVIKTGFTFEPSGYTDTVDTGDGDILTSNTLWDMKVLRDKFTSKHTLQVLMYWLMGKHSGQEIFRNITKIGLYNPRKNVACILETSKIAERVRSSVERDVLCYGEVKYE